MFNIFPSVFSSVFNSLINNRELIDNIVESVINSEVMSDVVNNLENMVNLDIEIKEYKRAYIIESNLPGVLKKDISIDYTNNYITVEVKRNQFFNSGKNISVAVFQQGNNLIKDFYVENIEVKNIRAVFKNELLKIYIPKKQSFDKDVIIVEVDNYISQ